MSIGGGQWSKCQLVVGNKESVRLLEELWLGEQPLASLFLRFFRLSSFHNIVIAWLASIPFKSGSWDFGFRRNSEGVEVMELSVLLLLLDKSSFLWRQRGFEALEAGNFRGLLLEIFSQKFRVG